MFTVEIEGTPQPTPRPRARVTGNTGTKIAQVYNPGATDDRTPYGAYLACLRREFSRKLPWDLYEPLRVDIAFIYRRPKSHWRKNGELAPGAKPFPPKHDLDNLTKGVYDSLVKAGTLKDDDCIVAGMTTKEYAPGRDDFARTIVTIGPAAGFDHVSLRMAGMANVCWDLIRQVEALSLDSPGVEAALTKANEFRVDMEKLNRA
jgi:Holliday junction resolvase RusA-like endonuclease